MIDKLPRFRFGLRTLLVLVTIGAMVLGVCTNWEYIPGTFFRDANGSLGHGNVWRR